VHGKQGKGKQARKHPEAGFSLLEMVLATAILMVGIISVVQLVPASVQSSSRNRFDTVATVIAQRELDQILAQPLSISSFLDSDNNIVSLGGIGTAGAPITMYGPMTIIDFSVPAASVPSGYIKPNYHAPNDPNGPAFELRWAVITRTSNGVILGKRFVIGCRQTNLSQPMFPVTLDSSVQR
jgi:type II secretory pathway pseudopilin PulG